MQQKRPLLSVQVLADVLSVLDVSCYSGFCRPVDNMKDILQRKPSVCYWLISVKKEHKTDIIDSFYNSNCQWL